MASPPRPESCPCAGPYEASGLSLERAKFQVLICTPPLTPHELPAGPLESHPASARPRPQAGVQFLWLGLPPPAPCLPCSLAVALGQALGARPCLSCLPGSASPHCCLLSAWSPCSPPLPLLQTCTAPSPKTQPWCAGVIQADGSPCCVWKPEAEDQSQVTLLRNLKGHRVVLSIKAANRAAA